VSYETIKYDVEHPLATISLDRPDALNALSKSLMGEVDDALARAEADSDVRVVILRGNGRAFSAGFDIADDEAWVEGMTPAAVAEEMRFYMEWERRIWSFPKAIIASVHGYCLAGACEVAMLCDLTIASEDAVFGEPEIRFATGPPALIMPWVVGIKAAKELLYSGKTIPAERALQIAMVNEVCSREDLDRRTRYHALLISRVSPVAVRAQKDAINRTFEIMGLHNALMYNIQVTGLLDATPTEEMTTFDAIRRERGLRAALDWRDEQFREVEKLA
jgi:enoyl-CoA hydratase